MTVSDGSSSAAPPPVGNTLEPCAGLPVWASAFEVGDITTNARAAIIVHARGLDTPGIAVSFNGGVKAEIVVRKHSTKTIDCGTCTLRQRSNAITTWSE